jgi:hypothetical protein
MHLRPIAATAVALLVSALPVVAHGADRGTAKVSIGGKDVAIDYGRPVLKGRDMLAKAEVGKPWRLGADSATTLTTDADLAFGPVAVPKGTYTLTATKTGDATWTLNIVQAAKDGASPKKIGDVPLQVTALPAEVEELTIDLKEQGATDLLLVSWGKTGLQATFSGK